MEQHLVKAEILWTRVCSLHCSYCSMADGRRNTVSLPDWEYSFCQLKKLGCSFAAFYGAEPLMDFDKLPEVIDFAEKLGIHTTVITSGVVSDLNRKLKTLYEHGLRSITTSYDINPSDICSIKKTKEALSVIEKFRQFGPVRDSAVVVTLTRENFRCLPEVIKELSTLNIWTFFDLIHPDRGQPGSKVKSGPTSDGLLFKKGDFAPLCDVLVEVGELKKQGLLCHASVPFMRTLKIIAAYLQTIPFKPVSPYGIWNCANLDRGSFPSWVTVDCDGTVYPCDDFQPKNVTCIKVWEIADLYPEFARVWREVVKNTCPGCLWNTHIDSNLIKAGILPIKEYIHGTE
jgi:MoaA/NifB/PqqE/SkfB family radical SAM enzyme